MKKFYDYIKKHIFVIVGCILAILFVTIGIPLIINWLFSIPACCDFFRVDWEAKDALAYYGSVLGFVGTVIFSGLALWQNHKIQEANDTHTKTLEQMEKDKNAPRFEVKHISSNGHTSKLKIHIVNITENIAENIYAYGFAIIDETGNALWRDDDVISIDNLLNNKVWEMQFNNPQITSNTHQIVFDMKYKDKYQDEHNCKVVGSFEDKIAVPKFKVTELK